jgi:predicted phage terminase large subunit-like protein
MASDKQIVACRYWDKAGSSREGSDYSAGVLVVRVGLYEYYIADVVRGQWEPDERNKVMLATARMDAARFADHQYVVAAEQEPGSGGKESSLLTEKQMAGFDFRPRVTKPDKETDWRPYAGGLQSGNIRLVEGDWNNDFINEHLSANFDNGKNIGKNDDQIDAACGAYKTLSLDEPIDLDSFM